MEIDTDKTKCITFQKKNEVSKKKFCFNGKILSGVADFVCLGLKIDAKGSFEKSIKFLSDKAMRGCFALNKKTKIRWILVTVALKLFDASILPVATYGAQIWTVFERFDSDT